MSIDDCNGCRSEDCDTCAARRYHAKHEHCLDCQRCLVGEKDAGMKVFGIHVGDASESDGDRCTRCVPCVQECACDSEYEHEMAEDESRRDFLRHYAGSDAAGKPMSAAEWHRLAGLRR